MNAHRFRPGTLTVASYWVDYLLDAARQMGCDLSDELSRLGISEELLSQPHARIPVRAEQALLRCAVERTADPFFGLHVGERVRPRFLGELGYAAMSSATLRQAMELAMPFQRVTTELMQLDVARESGRLSVIWHLPGPASDMDRHRVEMACAAAVTFGRWITDSGMNPLEVTLCHRAPPDTAEHQRIFRCPVRFAATHNSVVLDERLLGLPVRDADPEVHRIMRTRVHQAVTRFMARDNLLDQVRAQIQQQLLAGAAQLESVAEALNMKPWTLRRRLRAEDADFTTLLDDERKALAVDWLLNTGRPVSQIAIDLGYSEQSAFNRAFRRWFDCTPVTWRQRHLLGQAD